MLKVLGGGGGGGGGGGAPTVITWADAFVNPYALAVIVTVPGVVVDLRVTTPVPVRLPEDRLM